MPHKWGFKILGRSGVSCYLYDFDIYQGKTKEVDTNNLGTSANVVFKTASSLPSGCNFKLFAENFFSSLPLIQELEKCKILHVDTIGLPRMKRCHVMAEKDLKKKGRGAYDYRLDESTHTIAVCWFDNKVVNFVSSYANVEPVETLRRYNGFLPLHVNVLQSYIVQVYN